MSNTISIDELIEQEYEQQYFEECKFIWQNFVPKSGQARNLQGELLREIENIRCEAQDNGNVNWDDDLTYFCEFIKGEKDTKERIRPRYFHFLVGQYHVFRDKSVYKNDSKNLEKDITCNFNCCLFI